MSSDELERAYWRALRRSERKDRARVVLTRLHVGTPLRGQQLLLSELATGGVRQPLRSVSVRVGRMHLLLRIVPLGVTVALACIMVAMWLWPHAITFNYASAKQCMAAPTLLPDVYSADANAIFVISRPATVKIFGAAVYSPSVCVAPVKTVQGGAIYQQAQTIKLLGLFLSSPVTVRAAAYPTAQTTTTALGMLPLAKPLQYHLSSVDAVFDYYLDNSRERVRCATDATLVSCNLASLHLSYGTSYYLTLARGFHGGQLSTVTSLDVTTITAADITSSSIANGAIVYDAPQQVTLTANKSLKSLAGLAITATVNGQAQNILVTQSIAGKTVTVHFDALPRRAAITLRIGQVTATDGSQLEQPYELDFTTSGGPKVTGVNIGSSGVSLSPTIIIYFDQPLQAGQAAAGLATLTANNVTLPATIAISGSQLVLAVTSSLQRCAVLTIHTSAGVISRYGFSGDSAWSYGSRTLCYTTFNIGTSVQGRSITAYQFGSGGDMVLYIGAMHGSESNSARLLNKWIDELDAYPDRIPVGRAIVVIPQINPDGVAANTRQNAHNVDLNRNFPSYDWQTQVTEPGGGGVITNEGGPTPLSEPESQAIASYVQAQKPRLVLSYHSYAALAQGNGSGDADPLGLNYAALAGYWGVTSTYTGTLFDYTTTGSFEAWMHDRLNLPEIIVELRTTGYDEFSANRPALWAMAQI